MSTKLLGQSKVIRGIKKRGQLQYSSTAIMGQEYKMWYFSKLNANQYLIVIPKIFKKDPFDFTFSIILKSKFDKMSKGNKLQELTQ